MRGIERIMNTDQKYLLLANSQYLQFPQTLI
jgi:hypothetical protein